MTAPLELSVVIPAYNEAARIALTLSRTVDYLERKHPSSEVLVVDDGSTDDTSEIVLGISGDHGRVRLLRQHENQGKGAAVRRGMLEARGGWRLFMDADLATPIEELEKLLVYGKRGAEVVVGSRGLATSDVRVRQPWPREMMGRTFNVLVRSLLMGGYRDTQCGFKLFTANAAEALFARQTIDGFAFDVELLLLAKDMGFRVDEVPVVWRHAPNSKVSPVFDASHMLTDLIRLRLRRQRRSSGPDDSPLRES